MRAKYFFFERRKIFFDRNFLFLGAKRERFRAKKKNLARKIFFFGGKLFFLRRERVFFPYGGAAASRQAPIRQELLGDFRIPAEGVDLFGDALEAAQEEQGIDVRELLDAIRQRRRSAAGGLHGHARLQGQLDRAA